MYCVQANFRRCGSFQEKRRKHLEIFFLGFPVMLFYFLSERLNAGAQHNWNTIINPTGRSHRVWWNPLLRMQHLRRKAKEQRAGRADPAQREPVSAAILVVAQCHKGACTHSMSVLLPAGPIAVSWGQNSRLKDSIQFQVSAKLWDEIWNEKENPHRFMSPWAQIVNFCFGG